MRHVAPLVYMWALPATLVGLAAGAVACASGARAAVVDGVLEIAGGGLGRAIARLPRPFCFSAITFGHVVIAVDDPRLDASRAHERVHVRQYERWGIFFFPLYLGSSLMQALRGGDAYWDNHFEREARAHSAGPGNREIS
jgi:hypothetical protein